MKVTIANYVEIAASPTAVRRAILGDYVEAKKFREMGAIVHWMIRPRYSAATWVAWPE